MVPLLLLLLLLLMWTPTTAEKTGSLSVACDGSPICRALFQQDRGEVSEIRFQTLLQNIPSVDLMDAATIDQATVTSLVADRLALYQLVYSESRCPPNRYWFWNDTVKQGSCRCYFDSDCRTDITSLCHPQTHPIILIAFSIVICFGIFYIVSNNCTPTGKREKRMSKRV